MKQSQPLRLRPFARNDCKYFCPITYPTLTLPDALGRELIFRFPPKASGGLRGIKGGNLTCVYTIASCKGGNNKNLVPSP